MCDACCSGSVIGGEKAFVRLSKDKFLGFLTSSRTEPLRKCLPTVLVSFERAGSSYL